jgi:hypothetical protein
LVEVLQDLLNQVLAQRILVLIILVQKAPILAFHLAPRNLEKLSLFPGYFVSLSLAPLDLLLKCLINYLTQDLILLIFKQKLNKNLKARR